METLNNEIIRAGPEIKKKKIGSESFELVYGPKAVVFVLI